MDFGARIVRTRATLNPHSAAKSATGAATRYASVMSGWTWVIARIASRTKHRKATDKKKQITPVTSPIPALKKNLLMPAVFPLYVRITL
jgi:hypothetical protein